MKYTHIHTPYQKYTDLQETNRRALGLSHLVERLLELVLLQLLEGERTLDNPNTNWTSGSASKTWS